jgi:hypothetical protein
MTETATTPAPVPAPNPANISALVARVVEILGINLKQIEAIAHLPPGGLKIQTALTFAALASALDGTNRFVVEATGTAAGMTTEQIPRQAFRVSCTYQILYEVSSAAAFPPLDALQHFAQLNGMVNAYPYLREHLQNTVQRMGFDPVVIPVFRAPRAPDPKPAQTVRTPHALQAPRRTPAASAARAELLALLSSGIRPSPDQMHEFLERNAFTEAEMDAILAAHEAGPEGWKKLLDRNPVTVEEPKKPGPKATKQPKEAAM